MDDHHDAMKEELKILEQGLRELSDQKVKETAVTHENILYDSLLTQMEKLSQPEEESKSDWITYELYCKPTQPHEEIAEIASLEGRIAAVESSLGNTTMMPYDNIASALSEVQMRLSTFDRSRIDSIHKRIAVMTQDVDNILKKKSQLDHGVNDDKVNELYEMCSHWRATAATLPVVLERLHALKVIHEQSGSFATRITLLERQQTELTKMLETCNKALQQVQVSMTSNVTTMRNNMLKLVSIQESHNEVSCE